MSGCYQFVDEISSLIKFNEMIFWQHYVLSIENITRKQVCSYIYYVILIAQYVMVPSIVPETAFS